MPAKIVVPELGESVLEATVGHWRKKEGDRVSVGEVVVELETDKVDLEVGAERGGTLTRIERKEGEDVKIGDVLGIIDDAPPRTDGDAAGAAEPGGRAGPEPAAREVSQVSDSGAASSGAVAPEVAATPSARRLAREHEVDLARVPGGGDGGRITKDDVERYVGTLREASPPAADSGPAGANRAQAADVVRPGTGPASGALPTTPVELRHAMPETRREDRIRMSRRRQTIARRLVEAQHTAAMLTTFNEADMGAVMELRKRQKESFKQKHGVSLGVVSFFVKASVTALRDFPNLNAEIQGDEIVLKRYCDIGIAVGAPEGLVVPVLRDAERKSFAEIERAVKDFARKAQDRRLSLEDLRGGTFTITNGGVFGSLMSTPILNPPQVGILGLHKVQERPVSVSGAVAVRPMMYLALSYDHRIVDGLEAVQFLVRIKELVEDPGNLLLEA